MAITNFGTKMKLTGTSTLVLYDPDPISSGNNERIPASLETEYWSLPLNFRFGVSYTAPLSEDHHLVLAVDASHPSDDYESLNVGGEYVFNDLIALRGGYKGLFLTEGEESFTLGLGLRQRFLGNVRIRIDYAYVDFGRLKNVQKFSLGFDF